MNAVNTAGVMGKGLALRFKKAFPGNFAAYRRACAAGEVRIGEVFVFDLGTQEPRYILDVPTKEHWRNPSTLAYVEAGLADLVAQVQRLGIRSVAVPALGCGLGGLAWDDARPRIEAALAALPDVKVVLFAPGGG